MSSSVLYSQSMIITTAMAISGAVILLSLCKIKNLPSIQQLPINHNPSSLPSCLSSERVEGGKNKKKKRVKFADNVKEEKVGKFHAKKKKSIINENNLRRKKVSEIMPANRAALYHGIIRDRLNRVESY